MVKFVTTIVDHGMKDEISKIYNSVGINYSLYAHGKGTASSNTLEILGLADSPKAILFCLTENEKFDSLIEKLSKQYEISKKGKGITFAINISGISKASYDKLIGKEVDVKKEKENMNNEDNNYELVMTIVEEDDLEKVKDAAINAGAKGGTSIKALGLGTEVASKFFGITISPEKEIMLNVVKKEEKKKIMEAITKELEINKEGKGICFSIPVGTAIGLV